MPAAPAWCSAAPRRTKLVHSIRRSERAAGPLSPKILFQNVCLPWHTTCCEGIGSHGFALPLFRHSRGLRWFPIPAHDQPSPHWRLPQRSQRRHSPRPRPRRPPRRNRNGPFTGNLGLYSQYVFRGISQTNEKPAVQGGFDLGHKSGFYAGTWASNVSWIADGYFSPPNPPPAPSASMEWDFYGGYKGSLPADFALRPRRAVLLVPRQATRAASPSRTRRSSTPALTWKWLSLQVQLERQRQDVRPRRFARLAVPRPHRLVRHHREGQRRRSAR